MVEFKETQLILVDASTMFCIQLKEIMMVDKRKFTSG
jgi:hypothetical protein